MNYINGITKIILLSFTFCIAIIINKTIPYQNQINNPITTLKDVVFINGCNPNYLPHPYRYRVLHQMEQLDSGFLESDQFFYLNFDPNIIRNYRVIILFRCPWTKNIEQAIILANSLNKKVLFDIDDLVIDKKYILSNIFVFP